jgi:CDP-4-dehydro-6-deoxyglucose reductase
MLADFPDMHDYALYACGSVGMIEAAVPTFIEHGLDKSYCYSDAFVPAQSPSQE